MQRGLLIGNQIRLTPLLPTDASTMAVWYQDTNFLRMMDALPAIPQTEAQMTLWISEQVADRTGYGFAIRPLDDETILGWIGLDGILWTNRVAGIAIAIGDKANRGKGYGREAMNLLLDFAFNELNLYRLQLGVFAYNTNAIKLYESLGFVHEGTAREFIERDGQRHDMLRYGLLRGEYVNLGE